MELIKRFLQKILPDKLYWLFGLLIRRQIQSTASISFSQEGEDLLLDRYFNFKKRGFYVDVGAHHPIRFSNTWLFYTKGWQGINIDAKPGTKQLFEHFRPRDINIDAGISTKAGTLNYYMFQESALNTFDKSLATERITGACPLLATTHVAVQPLASLLASAAKEMHEVDFMTIDTEGFDLQVLQTNDWSRIKPKLVLVEVRSVDAQTALNSSTCAYLSQVGYRLLMKLQNTCVFERIVA
jgi:FkbM family methyltransferase